jgi:hypothetical protein
MTAPSGWYPDPTGVLGQRYFDGNDWTEHRAVELSRDERAARLDHAIAECIQHGGRVESHADYQAVVVYGKHVQPHPVAVTHLLHLRTALDRMAYRVGYPN